MQVGGHDPIYIHEYFSEIGTFRPSNDADSYRTDRVNPVL